MFNLKIDSNKKTRGKKSSLILLILSSFLMVFAPTLSASADTTDSAIASQLKTYTDTKSAGPTQNYYYETGEARLSEADFQNIRNGGYQFSSDSQGRSDTARAVLTYEEYVNSAGSRQGNPLDPPNWPTFNPTIFITFSLNGGTYNSYFYNRSHSIADSLLGSASYTSKYNFTTGTRSQNVGVNQSGGMRAAEILAEKYWANHPNTTATIKYETTPIYYGDEKIPRGSIVDEYSSDGVLNIEIVVLNDAEGVSMDYYTGSATSDIPTTAPVQESPVSAPTTSTNLKDVVYVASKGTSTVYWYYQSNMPSATNLANVVTMTEAQALATGKHHSLSE